MAQYQEVDYRTEGVKSVANPGGFGRHGGGGQQQVVKETFEEVDKVSRAGGKGHGHGNRGHFEARETMLEEDFNTRTGEVHERKENLVDI